jgi:hypothetical protein
MQTPRGSGQNGWTDHRWAMWLLCLPQLRREGVTHGGKALLADVVPRVRHANDTILSLSYLVGLVSFAVKGEIHMPFGDRTGPLGKGPMSGRAAGLCAGLAAAENTNPVRGAGDLTACC